MAGLSPESRPDSVLCHGRTLSCVMAGLCLVSWPGSLSGVTAGLSLVSRPDSLLCHGRTLSCVMAGLCLVSWPDSVLCHGRALSCVMAGLCLVSWPGSVLCHGRALSCVTAGLSLLCHGRALSCVTAGLSLSCVMAGLSLVSWPDSLLCHGRAWPGHPRLSADWTVKSWVARPSPAMTQENRLQRRPVISSRWLPASSRRALPAPECGSRHDLAVRQRRRRRSGAADIQPPQFAQPSQR
jgi:hypothetical protein